MLLFNPIKHMEGYNPQETTPQELTNEEAIYMIYHGIYNFQAGLVSFEDVRQSLVAWAKEVLNKSDRRECKINPTALSSSDPSSLKS